MKYLKYVNSGSGNGLLPDSAKPLSELMLTYHQWALDVKQGKSEGFDSCDRPSNLTKIAFKS